MLARRFTCRLALLGALWLPLSPPQSFADIYKWAWVNSGDPSQGVVQSSTLCLGGSGVNAVPGANLASLDLTQAYLVNANLSAATFSGGTLTDALLTGGTISGTNFSLSNLTSSQLYGTASYQTNNLQGLGLMGNDLTGWDFSSQDLTGGSLKNTNLSTAAFLEANLTGADLSGATLSAANFGITNLTSSQLYSTASYQAHDLGRIGFDYDILNGWNLAGQNLSFAFFENAKLVNSNLAGANLKRANFFSATLDGANLTGANLQQANMTFTSLNGANLSGADVRGTELFDGTGAIQTNMIGPTGTIQGLNVGPGFPLMTVRNSSVTLPIHVTGGATVASGGTLQFVFDGPIWRSTISFDASSSVALGGNIDLQIAAGVDPTTLLGHNLQLFDWTGVSPTGQFGQITNNLPAGYAWNTSALYSTGIIDLTQVPVGPTNGQWATNGGGTWSSTANWTGGNVPGEPQDTASFGTVLTAGTAHITLDTNANLASLAFSTTGGASYAISTTSGNSLILSNTAGPATITDSGSNSIAVPITIESNLSVSAATASVLTIAGAISDSGSHSSLTFNGPGKLILSGTNSYSGGTFVESGKVVVTNRAALLDGSNLTIGNSAAFAPVVPAGSSDGTQNAAAAPSPVPEPSTLAILAVAAIGVLGYRRRR
jgi:autotransporter-associated beta strand protein